MLQKSLDRHPLGREILPYVSKNEPNFPLFSVNSLSLQADKQHSVNDIEEEETLFSKSPDYMGEAKVNSDILDPCGVDVPTLIHPNPESAINLDKFPKEIQPYIKEIFLEKHREVVSLHSLDAGDLSLTLGFTQLRLRPGETLPRNKRLFHISPGDRRHLDDILDLMIRFGYVCKSPIEPDGSHLYGMASYLVPRAKPGCMGRLIVDFSPVNSLIQSPASVIPELTASLQFLQGKALFTGLDLRYAYLALKIDKESQKSTTFLTPSGSFRWLSIPTGSANSPIYFTDA